MKLRQLSERRRKAATLQASVSEGNDGGEPGSFISSPEAADDELEAGRQRPAGAAAEVDLEILRRIFPALLRGRLRIGGDKRDFGEGADGVVSDVVSGEKSGDTPARGPEQVPLACLPRSAAFGIRSRYCVELRCAVE